MSWVMQLWVDRTLGRPLGVVGGGVGVGVVVWGVVDDWWGLHRCNLIAILAGQSDVAPEVDLTNSIANPQVEIGLFYNVHQRAFRLSSRGGSHGIVRPQHCHP